MVFSKNEIFKQPSQKRSRDTLSRVVRAVRCLLEEKRFDDLSIQEITARAGCSVGTFYERFKNKDALLPYLLDLHYTELESRVLTLFSVEAKKDSDVKDRVERVVNFLIETAYNDRGLIRTLVLNNLGRTGGIPDTLKKRAKKLLEGVYTYLLECAPERDGGEKGLAVEIGLLMVVAAIREKIILTGSTQASTLSVSQAVFGRELKMALLAYLASSWAQKSPAEIVSWANPENSGPS